MKHLSSVATLLSMLCAGVATAQTPTSTIINQTFKDDPGSWTVFGSSATVAVTHDSPAVAPGSGALKFGYSVAKGDISALVYPVDLGSLAHAKSLKFRVRADSNTVVAVVLQEQDGGRYIALCMAPKDKWQAVELSTADFALSTEKTDPPDPDGKLDMDQVTGIGVTDIAQLFAQGGDSDLTAMFGLQKGSHSLLLDNFSVGTAVLPSTISNSDGNILLETFAHPQLAWLGLGGTELVRSTDKPMDGPSLKFSYRQAPGKVAIVTHGLPPGTLTGASSLTLDIASLQPSKILIQIEEVGGGNYNTMVDIPGGSVVDHLNLAFDTFKQTDDSKDDNNKLDLDKIKTILIMDGSGMIDQADHDNTLWINHVVAHR